MFAIPRLPSHRWCTQDVLNYEGKVDRVYTADPLALDGTKPAIKYRVSPKRVDYNNLTSAPCGVCPVSPRQSVLCKENGHKMHRTAAFDWCESSAQAPVSSVFAATRCRVWALHAF